MNIRIVEKPDWISVDDVAQVLQDAHKTTVASGMNFTAARATGEYIRRRLGENGKLLVALTDENILVGVIGVSFHPVCKMWFGKGKPYGELKLLGVKGAYKGQGISTKLFARACSCAFDQVDLVVMDTAENNKIVLNDRKRQGWIAINYRTYKSTNYYSVVLAKWRDQNPFSERQCQIAFQLSKIYNRIRFKPGRIKRFGF